MVIIGGGRSFGNTPYKNIRVALTATPIGVGSVYINSDDKNPAYITNDDEAKDVKLTLGENNNDANEDNISEENLKGYYPVQLQATPKHGYIVRGFVKEQKVSYTDEDFLKGDDNKNGLHKDDLEVREADGTYKLWVNVNINRETVGEDLDDAGRESAKNNYTDWDSAPDHHFYAVFAEGICTYKYADGQEPMKRQFGGSMGTITQTPSPEETITGTMVTLEAEPTFGSHFVKWVDNEGNEYTDNPLTFNADLETIYTAYFAMNDFLMNSTGIRSYSSQKAFRIADDDELGAYCVKEIADGQVKLDGPFKIVPDCRGAILMGTPDATFTFQPLNSETDENTIFFFQSGEGASFNSDERIKGTAEGPVTADGTQYALGKRNDVVGFYRVKSGVTIPRGKAYIVVTGSAKDFIGFADDDVTNSIAAQIAERMSDDVVYNLQGQRVADDYRGLVIKNGKKFINQ